MQRVGVNEGIGYGLRVMAYYVGVIAVGSVISLIGFTMFTSGAESESIGTMLFGGIVVLAGILSFYGGLFGAVYKIIADGVAKGNVMSSPNE